MLLRLCRKDKGEPIPVQSYPGTGRTLAMRCPGPYPSQAPALKPLRSCGLPGCGQQHDCSRRKHGPFSDLGIFRGFGAAKC
jgi:hypothetical protein